MIFHRVPFACPGCGWAMVPFDAMWHAWLNCLVAPAEGTAICTNTSCPNGASFVSNPAEIMMMPVEQSSLCFTREECT